MTKSTIDCKRGDIFYADLGDDVLGSEQGGVRPVLIIQNDIGNHFAPTTIVAPFSSKRKNRQPTHCFVLHSKETGLTRNSCLLLEQIRTISQDRLVERIGSVPEEMFDEINLAISVSLGLVATPYEKTKTLT